MTKEDKELLLKYLCMALPYGVMVNVEGYDTEKLIGIENETITTKATPTSYSDKGEYPIDIVRPYLRPISSMTEEEVDCLFKILDINEDLATEWLKVNDIGIIRLFTQQGKDFYEIAEAMDYLNSIHIDYIGLIEKGLAIEVTKENNPYENGL